MRNAGGRGRATKHEGDGRPGDDRQARLRPAKLWTSTGAARWRVVAVVAGKLVLCLRKRGTGESEWHAGQNHPCLWRQATVKAAVTLFKTTETKFSPCTIFSEPCVAGSAYTGRHCNSFRSRCRRWCFASLSCSSFHVESFTPGTASENSLHKYNDSNSQLRCYPRQNATLKSELTVLITCKFLIINFITSFIFCDLNTFTRGIKLKTLQGPIHTLKSRHERTTKVVNTIDKIEVTVTPRPIKKKKKNYPGFLRLTPLA